MSSGEIVIDVQQTELVVDTGVQGPAGPGVPDGGTANQVLAKVDATDYNTQWVTGGGGGLSAEEVRDSVAAFVVGGDNLDATHDDGADTLTLDVTGLAAVATSGDYADLANTPSIPSAIGDLTGVSAFGETLVDDADAPTARTTLGLGSVAILNESDVAAAVHTHTLSAITDSGTAAGLDVPASGDAAAGEVVKGDDTRLTDNRDPTAHTHVIANIIDLSLDMQSFLAADTDALARTALGLGDAAVEDASAFADASHDHTEADVTDLKREYERAYFADGGGSALGTGGKARYVAITTRKITGAGITLDASDTGTITISILNSSGVVQHTATLTVTTAISVTSTSLSWDTGDGTVDAGEIVEVERTSGFATATNISAPVRFEEDA